MTKIYKVGIIGCGGIATGKHMPALQKQNNVIMVAFCDIDGLRAQKAAEQFGSDDAIVYTDYRLLLEDPSIDIVHVCTPNDSHAEISIAAMYANKHVMCEKPMAKTAVDAKRMVEAAKQTGKKLTVGYQNRFRSDAQFLKQICEAGELGEIYYGKAHAVRRRAVPTWGVFLDEEKQGGGPLIDIGTHALDLTLWMMDNYKPQVVLGTTFHKLSQRENAANAWGSWDPNKFKVEDSSVAMIKMQNGATIMLEASWALNILSTGEAKTTLCGTEGGVDMDDGLRINGERFSKLFTNHIDLDAHGVDFYDGSSEDPAELEARLWIEAIDQDKEPLVTPEQACIVSEILEAIYVSAHTGKAVYFE